MKIQHVTYLSLGTNQGNKLENLQNAIDLIADKVGSIQKISSVYKTASWGFDSDDFFNICLKVTTQHPPEKLMQNFYSLLLLKSMARQLFFQLLKIIMET